MGLQAFALVPAGVSSRATYGNQAAHSLPRSYRAVPAAKRSSSSTDVGLMFGSNSGFALLAGQVAQLGAFGAVAHLMLQKRTERQGRLHRGAGAATATLKKVDKKTKTATALRKKVDAKTKTQTQTSRDMWGVIVHAPIRSCNTPWCRVPGLRRIVCTCFKDGRRPGAVISSNGRSFTLDEFAELVGEGVPELSPKETHAVSSRLFESGMTSPAKMGTAVVIATYRRAADDYHKKLTSLGLWTSVEQLDAT